MDPSQMYSQQQVPLTAFNFNFGIKGRREDPPRSYPLELMHVGEDTITANMSMWNIPFEAQLQHHFADSGHGRLAYNSPEEHQSMPVWATSGHPSSPNHSLATIYDAPHDCFDEHAISNNAWLESPCKDISNVHLGEDSIGQAFTTDENVPIIDLSCSSFPTDADGASMPNACYGRRMSGSSFTLSTTGATSDMPSFEEFSANMSDFNSYYTDHPSTSNRNSMISSTHSPVASPRYPGQPRTELIRTQSRGRASPSPRPCMRSAPYTTDGSGRNKRWSTGSYASAPARKPSPFTYNHTTTFDAMTPEASSRVPSPTPQEYIHSDMVHLQPPLFIAQHQNFSRNSVILPSQSYQEQTSFPTPPPLLSHGILRMLQSNADSRHIQHRYADLSEPPSLYAALHEEQLAPQEADMNPDDPDMVPHEQELRFEGDLYTPRWVRGHGNKREGWCGICKPGRWLVLKNSAFWYDKSFTHGISAATGSAFLEPLETRRTDNNPDVWEGLCNSCGDWIALVSSKKKGTTWFRHAYKCHTHPKIKDAPKRRRESGHTRQAQATPARIRGDAPLTPQATPIYSQCRSPIPGERATEMTCSPAEMIGGMI